MNNITELRKLVNNIYKILIINKDTSIIIKHNDFDNIYNNCVVVDINSKRIVFIDSGRAYIDCADGEITFLNNEGTASKFSQDVGEEELFQQSLLEETLSLFEVEKILEIYSFVKENSIW